MSLSSVSSLRFKGYQDFVPPEARVQKPWGLGGRMVPVVQLDTTMIRRKSMFREGWDHIFKLHWPDRSVSYFKHWYALQEYGAVILGNLLGVSCVSPAELAAYPKAYRSGTKHYSALMGCLRDKIHSPYLKLHYASHPKMAVSLEDLYIYCTVAWVPDMHTYNVKYRNEDGRYHLMAFDNGYSASPFAEDWDLDQEELFGAVAGRPISKAGLAKVQHFLHRQDQVIATLRPYYSLKQIQQMFLRAQTLLQFPVIVGSAHAFRKQHRALHYPKG